MTTEPHSDPSLSVPGWTDRLSGLQSRRPGLWIGLGNLESRMLADRLRPIAIDRPVWVTGVARSGTTILLEMLARHPDVATHRYRDFPPVLVPWFWNWFVDHAGGTNEAAKERAHGDGIEVTPESPEAFEEVIWMAFFPDLHDPDVTNGLTAATENPAFETFYRDHLRKMLMIRGGARYLAKANYNLTRLPYLLSMFPDARFVVPFRDPVRHVASLIRQHERFCGEHGRDERLKHHMSRSGHFEFGLDRRPINRGNAETTRQIRALWDAGSDVEGWALYWKDIHGYVADLLESDDALRRAVMLVDYEDFCRRPAEVMHGLLAHCELPPTSADIAGAAGRIVRQPSYYDSPFSEDESALVGRVAGPVHDRLRALVRADAGRP